MERTPCVFFDRDGIVNQSPGPGYVERVEHTGESGGAIRIEYVNDWRARADDSAT